MSEHVLKPRNMEIQERQKPSSPHQITSLHHHHDHAEIRQIIQQFASRTESITITNEWRKYHKYPEKSDIATD